jgi:predicted CoA-substrate-specific enzyme activase
VKYIVGLDIGSTTVKAVVISRGEGFTNDFKILWSDYKRHGTRQAEKALDFLSRIESRFGRELSIFVTGSGGRTVAELINAKFVQEVNAVALAVEKFYPDAGSIIELGGQDAKIIIWIDDEKTGQRIKFSSMNDKCAGGTGAVIDRISNKLKISSQELRTLKYFNVKIHPVAGKCGVFAETDINGLQKQGVPREELMASLFEAIVQQNLSVLTRGYTLRPKVLLLGGPNTFIPALQDAWRYNIIKLWKERKFPLPEGVDPYKLIFVPENSLYFAAIGCALFGLEESEIPVYRGGDELKKFILVGRRKIKESMGERGLVKDWDELEEFRKAYSVKPWTPPELYPGQVVEGYLGIDAGSTSTKAVFVSDEIEVLARAYQLSRGNPIEDVKDVLRNIKEQFLSSGVKFIVKGVGVTGYAKDILKDIIGADVAIVETVAHTRSALFYFDDIDVIVDVGGQDIKVMFLRDGKVKDFKLNTQCSAGNGYFLQSTAYNFGIDISEYADRAFQAEFCPVFNFGCAVFLEQDIVNFQRLGWGAEEIMAGLAKVLPKNIWLYVVQEPNLKKFGKRFLLQGGTQYNLAVVKAEVDFIKAKVPDAEIFVHPYTGECGAIGAAIEARDRVGETTKFIGFEKLDKLRYQVKRDESTRCYFCKNRCLRTFIDAFERDNGSDGEKHRYIIATCEKGMTEDVNEMRSIKRRMDEIKKEWPNFVEIQSRKAFESMEPESVCVKRRIKFRGSIRIGIPRVLNMYVLAPFFTAYFESLGIKYENIVFSDYTSEKLYKEGSRRGTIDPCFPSKVCIAHVHNLLYKKNNPRRPLNLIFFPKVNSLSTEIVNTINSWACPTVSATPETVKAAFTKEKDIFAELGVKFVSPVLHFSDRDLLEVEMWEVFKGLLKLKRVENERAVDEGFRAMDRFYSWLRSEARKVMEKLERMGRVGIVIIGRPYHNDPGLNHLIPEELQKLGYPIFTIMSLPIDDDILVRLFDKDLKDGRISHPMEIRDVWKNCYSENTNRKVWAAKYVARHPNLIAVELSNFRCGHDAPVYSLIESILDETQTPFFTFHELDENRPASSIKIRIETIDYFLKKFMDSKLKNEVGLCV